MLKHNLRWAAVARAIGLRVAVWGGVAALVLPAFGDIRPLVLPRGRSSEWTACLSLRQARYACDRKVFQAARLLYSRDGCTPKAPGHIGWPQLRGPNHDGFSAETDLADAGRPTVRPCSGVRDLGCGYSGFAAVGDRVYTQTQIALRPVGRLFLEADTGRTIWEQRYDWPYDAAGMYPGPRATPTYCQGRVYYASPQGRVGCLDADDGRPLWSLNVI